MSFDHQLYKFTTGTQTLSTKQRRRRGQLGALDDFIILRSNSSGLGARLRTRENKTITAPLCSTSPSPSPPPPPPPPPPAPPAFVVRACTCVPPKPPPVDLAGHWGGRQRANGAGRQTAYRTNSSILINQEGRGVNSPRTLGAQTHANVFSLGFGVKVKSGFFFCFFFFNLFNFHRYCD